MTPYNEHAFRSYSLEPLHLLKRSANPPGVYRFASRARSAPILAMITDWGWVGGNIEGREVNDKQQFLAAVGQAFAFPDYYGRNWDAFEEMINDLSWIPATGYLLLYDHAHRFASSQPEAWQTAISILQSAAIRWQQAGVPFYVLLRHNRRWNRNLPKFAA